MAADFKRTSLLAELKELEAKMEKGKGKDVTDRLNVVYEELRAIGADQVRKNYQVFESQVFKLFL